MTWALVFQAGNVLALLFWLALILLPRWNALLSAVMYGGVALLCLAYTALLLSLQFDLLDPGAVGDGGRVSFMSIEGVRAIFMSDGGVTVGWLHYLALDLFAGLWIAKDADAKGFSRLVQAPVLLLTFVAGPAGLLVWLVLRERRARKAARSRL